MKFRMKRWMWIVGGMALVVIGGGIWAFGRSGGEAAQMLTDVVKRGDLHQTVEATGSLESVDRVDLAFNASGTLGDVFVRVGQTVQAGDRLAELEGGERAAEYDEAVQALAQAQANLDQKYAGESPEAIAVVSAGVSVAQAALTAADVALSSAQTSLDLTVSQQDVLVAAARNTLDQEAAEIATDEARVDADLENALTNAVIQARAGLSAADEVLGVDNTFANNAYEGFLSALDSTALTDATNAYEDASLSLGHAEDVVYGLSEDPTDAELQSAADAADQALQDTSLTLLYTRRVLDATEIETAEFSSSDLSALKSDIDYQRDSIQNAQESLSINKNAWDTAQVDNDTRLISAKDGLAQAEAARDSAVASAEASLASAEAGVASAQAELARAQAQYDDTTAPPRGVDVAALIAAVSQARANLAAASVRLGNTQVVSPIDGIVTEIAFDPGEQVVGGTAVVTVQTADENQFKIVVDVPEADIAKIAYGDAADLTFDAFGDDVHVAGSVADIDPAEKTVEGVVFYEVSIYLDTSSLDLPLKPGMSAEVTITTDTRTGVLFVPQRAVLEHDDGTKYVRIPRDDVFDERAVETGLRADDGKLEILSGVSEGEVIVLSLHSK